MNFNVFYLYKFRTHLDLPFVPCTFWNMWQTPYFFKYRPISWKMEKKRSCSGSRNNSVSVFIQCFSQLLWHPRDSLMRLFFKVSFQKLTTQQNPASVNLRNQWQVFLEVWKMTIIVVSFEQEPPAVIPEGRITSRKQHRECRVLSWSPQQGQGLQCHSWLPISFSPGFSRAQVKVQEVK